MMERARVREAAELLAAARRTRRPLASLPEPCRPGDFRDAAAIQDATVEALGESIAAYKVAGTESSAVMWGAILASITVRSPAQIEASGDRPIGIEAEIAFRLTQDIAESDRAWTAARFDAQADLLPAIEIVATRFTDLDATPVLDRAADFMSNGALVCGEPVSDWSRTDFTALDVTLDIAGERVVSTTGGHAAGDPRRPVLAFLNAPHRSRPLPKGSVITAGTFTGLVYAKPGDEVVARLGPFGSVRVTLTA